MGRNMHKKLMAFIIHTINDEWRNNSIYRGAALRIEPNGAVTFLKLNGDTELVFEPRSMRGIAACILSRIKRRDALRAEGIPLKAGVLMYGPYGTGKTALALKLAKAATEHQLTYLQCASPRAFAVVKQMVEMYRQSLMMIEDIERLGDEDGVDDMVNWLDAVETKSLETLFLATTNDLAKVKGAMAKLLRPGRVDHLINFTLPGPDERLRLFRLELPSVLGDIGNAVNRTDGCNAAAIRQVAQRAKQMALYNGQPLDPMEAEYVNDAADSYIAYLEAVKEAKPNDGVTVEQLIGSVVEDRVRHVVRGM